MARAFRNYDHEAVAKICDVLEIDRQGLVGFSIEWNIKGLISYKTEYVHAGRKRSEVTKEATKEVLYDSLPSWRDDPLL